MTPLRSALLMSAIVTACTHQPPRVAAPDELIHCYQLAVGEWRVQGPRPVPVRAAADLPRAVNLGTARGRESPLQVGTLVPDTGDVRVLWRLVRPDSLVLDFIPARGGVTFLQGIRLHARLMSDSLSGEANLWSDDLGYEPRAPVAGRRVRCPAGAAPHDFLRP